MTDKIVDHTPLTSHFKVYEPIQGTFNPIINFFLSIPGYLIGTNYSLK